MDSDYKKAALVLKNERASIQNLWEKTVRASHPKTNDKSSPVLSGALNIFMDELIHKLETVASSGTSISQEGMSEEHGGQRAHLKNYFLPQLLTEFSVLRSVINEVLHEKNVLTYEVRSLIDHSIDSVISLAATEFASVQQDNIRRALEDAETSNRDLDQFALVAAHDLKSPLATISSFIEVINDEFGTTLGKDGLKYIQTIQGASERMRRLIDSLLDYSRLTTPEKGLHPVDVNEVLQATLQNLNKSIEDVGAVIDYSHLPTVMGDADFLNQLFQNLISNSIKFRSDNPLIVKIRAEDTGSMWKFTFEDNGIGFDPKHKDEIFGLYKKLHGQNAKYQGSGIGLATCKKVIDLHGGKIAADSVPGKGSTFTFTLPKI